jgi:hypothetical protein
VYPELATIIHACPPGTYWYVVPPQEHAGVDCESIYVLSVRGYVSPPVGIGASVRTESWGRVKALFR